MEENDEKDEDASGVSPKQQIDENEKEIAKLRKENPACILVDSSKQREFLRRDFGQEVLPNIASRGRLHMSETSFTARRATTTSTKVMNLVAEYQGSRALDCGRGECVRPGRRSK